MMFDPVLLRTFLVVAQTRSFTKAAASLGVRQPTVSQHIRRLEDAAGRQLFARDTHSVELTGDGEAMIGFADTILDGMERATAYFAGPQLRGRVRLGASEDIVAGQLPAVLSRFRRSHPLVELELLVEMSESLHHKLRAGELDLIVAKSRPGDEPGRSVRREGLVWAGVPDHDIDLTAPIPLIMHPEPSITRAHVIQVLQRSRRSWRIACTSASLNGLRAAVLAGLGVAVFARSLVPAGLVELDDGLPALGEVEFVLTARRLPTHGPVTALADAILAESL
ncbi:MAG TPA: LysR substrate-binding domain-containing protein [Pseudonocardiaceae bacterium]|jgi:DNA-binding transcriptional LysR family regulator|nr:LysR substrate-binding domain-containing protein [Pseudonocardiaceae bacterium]